MDRWDPFRDILWLRARGNRLFEETFPQPGEQASALWVPAIDICETPGEFVVMAELPEVSESDIALTVEDNTLRISGKRRSRREGRSYYQMERQSGVFSRSFILPAIINKNNIKATLKDGILNVVLPKKAEAMPKQIEIT
ncbi:MAG: Hsp20/alpha crystallin family protein [Nitrospirota bacterium]